MNAAQAKKIPLYDLLSGLGYSPYETRKSGNEIWYKSPFRQEAEPSFKIKLDQNIWYDFGEGVGGNVIDFAMRLNRCGFQDALAFLGNKAIQKHIVPKRKDEDAGQSTLAFFDTKSPLILDIKPVYHYALKNYLQERAINLPVAYKYLQEIHYQVEDQSYFGLGFPNDSGGWEVRNPIFKGCLGKKDISLIKTGSKQLLVFEGFFDFLTYQTIYKHQKLTADVLILNSVALKKKGIVAIKSGEYLEIDSYLDNDKSGNETLEFLKVELPQLPIHSMSYVFASYKDYNAFHVANTSFE